MGFGARTVKPIPLVKSIYEYRTDAHHDKDQRREPFWPSPVRLRILVVELRTFRH